MRAIVVIPTYNERENIAVLLEEIRKHVAGLHVLFVDDGSPDGTGEIADQLSRRYPWMDFVLHRPAKTGLGRAYVEGLRAALEGGYDLVLQMDGDLSHDHPICRYC
jgi:dolichol-phosphate mannosyltransferase